MNNRLYNYLLNKVAAVSNITLTPEQLTTIASQIDISTKVDKVTNYSLVANAEISKIHSNSFDHSNSSDHSNASDHSHSNASVLNSIQEALTTALKSTYDGYASGKEAANSNIQTHIGSAHAPSNAQKNSDITQAEIDAKISYNPKRLFANLAAPVASSGTTEKVLLQLQIPAARAVIGSTFRAWVVGNSSSTGTLIFRVKCGPNGSISDTEDWKSVTSAAQAANARAGFEALITIRSATTIAVDGVGYAGTVQLPTTIAAPATPAITISGIWYINITVVCSSGTFTAQVATIEEIR